MVRKKHYGIKTVFIVTMALTLFGCNTAVTPPVTDGREIFVYTKEPEKEESTDATQINLCGIVTEISETDKSITFLIPSKDEYVTLYFDGTTDFRNKYDKMLSSSQIVLGKIYNISYVKKSLTISEMQESNEAFEATGISNYSVDRVNKTITIGSKLYSYGSSIQIFSEGKPIDIIELSDRDEITVRGFDKIINSITVTKGHGYIKLTNYKPFVGGFIDVGTSFITKITGEEMLIVASEGTYKVSLENGEYQASRTVTIARDKEVELDFSDVVEAARQTGSLKLTVLPENAQVTVDDEAADYSKLIVLEYGEHTIQVNAQGYDTYSETITINSSYMAKTIDITGESETTTESETETEDETEDSTATETTGSASTVYKTYINAPEGAQVYMDGTYLGTVPVSTAKVSGTHVITFTKSGYENKTYIIDVDDDNDDAEFTFPEMLSE